MRGLAPTSKYAHARIRFLSLFFFFWLLFLLHFNRKEYTGSACVFSLSYLLKWFLQNDLDTPWMHCEKDKDCIYYVGNFFAL